MQIVKICISSNSFLIWSKTFPFKWKKLLFAKKLRKLPEFLEFERKKKNVFFLVQNTPNRGATIRIWRRDLFFGSFQTPLGGVMHFVKIHFSTKVLKYYFLAKFGTFSAFLGKFPVKIIKECWKLTRQISLFRKFPNRCYPVVYCWKY